MSRRIKYRKLLQDERWNHRRLEIMRRDGFCCRRCGKKGILNVHHRWYIYGRKPWQYPDRSLITLCEDCHHHIHLMRHVRFAVYLIVLIIIALVLKYVLK